jgi:hypothetical protein
MTEEQKKKKPGREIGSIQEQRWNHFGSEEEDSELSGVPGSQLSSEPDIQISSNLDSKVVHYQKSQKAQLSDSQITGEQDKQMVSYLRTKKPERKAQIAYLPPALIKRLKQYALDHEREISEVVADGVEQLLDGDPAVQARIAALETEIQQLQERLTSEQRFRTDTGVHHFKNWLRAHDQPQDSDFAKRFLADTRLPQHASRGMYEAKLRIGGYSEEDIHLFQDAWKTMLFTQ